MAADGVVLFGADGQLGHALQAELALLGRLIPLTLSDVDIADAQALRAIIRQHAPRYIVNAAAYTAVDKAEQEPSMAHAINATAPAIMAEEAKPLARPWFITLLTMCLMGVQTSLTKKAMPPTPYLCMAVPSAMAIWR